MVLIKNKLWILKRERNRNGKPNVVQRATKANPVFQIEKSVIQNLTREKSIIRINKKFPDEWKWNIG